MSYIVVYQREDGSSGVEECADLDLAVVTAERLRNVDSVERPRIFQTSEITYDFKPYYRVEVTSSASASDEMPPPPTATPVVATGTAGADTVAPKNDAPKNDAPKNDAPKKAPSAEPTTADAADAPAEKAATDAGNDEVTSSDTSRSGLFGDTENNADSPELPEVEQVEEAADAVPSRRGLFGR